VAALVCSPAWPHPTSQVTIYGWTTRELAGWAFVAGGLPTRLVSPWTGLAHRPSWYRRRPAGTAVVLTGRAISVPFRARCLRFVTVKHGHSRSPDQRCPYYRYAATRMVRMGSACLRHDLLPGAGGRSRTAKAPNPRHRPVLWTRMTDPEKAVALLGSGWVRPMHRVLGGGLSVVVLAICWRRALLQRVRRALLLVGVAGFEPATSAV
jgi:hypothetical protein